MYMPFNIHVIVHQVMTVNYPTNKPIMILHCDSIQAKDATMNGEGGEQTKGSILNYGVKKAPYKIFTRCLTNRVFIW